MNDNFNETLPNGNFEIIISKSNISITLFGIIGNIICILVLVQKQLINRKFNFYLLLLSFSELLFCLIVFLNSIIFYFKPLFAIYDMSAFTCLMTDYIVNTTDAYCVLLTLILSIDRLYAIVMPMRSRQFFTNLYPKRVALFSYILILIIKSPEILLTQRYYRTVTLRDPLTNEIRGQSSLCEERNQTKARKEAYVIICGIVLPFLCHILPALLILISNAILLRYIYEYSSKQIDIIAHTNVQSRSRSLTVTQKSHYFTIIIIGVWLLLTSIPYYTFNTIFWISRLNIYEKEFHLLFNYEYIQALFSVLFNSNHSINILIYIIFHKCFRTTLFKLLHIPVQTQGSEQNTTVANINGRLAVQGDNKSSQSVLPLNLCNHPNDKGRQTSLHSTTSRLNLHAVNKNVLKKNTNLSSSSCSSLNSFANNETNNKRMKRNSIIRYILTCCNNSRTAISRKVRVQQKDRNSSTTATRPIMMTKKSNNNFDALKIEKSPALSINRESGKYEQKTGDESKMMMIRRNQCDNSVNKNDDLKFSSLTKERLSEVKDNCAMMNDDYFLSG